MARVEATEISDSENEVASSPKKKTTNDKKVSMAPEAELSEEQVENGSDAGSEEGSEYEIESIITAKRSGTVSFSFLFLAGVTNTPSKTLTHTDGLFVSRLTGFHISSQLERVQY